jgi:Fe-S cluster assembly scaffold protein SufB
MAMKNVRNVHFWQIDNKIKNILKVKGVILLTSPEAWKKFGWTRKYFSKKPEQGYFIWVKEQINFPLFSCISIAHKNVSQKLQNLLIVEKDLKVSLQGSCNSLKKDLNGKHKANGKIILKQGSSLKYSHIHSWGEKDIVEPEYEFILEKDSKLDYTFKTLFTPKKLKINNSFNLFAGASCDIKTIANCVKTEISIKDVLMLKGKGASGVINLRLVGGKDSKVLAHSQVIADSESKGHLDCQGLLADKESNISLIPELVCKNKLAQITHEASIGRISQEQLSYLRMKGLTEKQATNLIINGFLEI